MKESSVSGCYTFSSTITFAAVFFLTDKLESKKSSTLRFAGAFE